MDGLMIFGRTGQVARELARLAPEARFVGRDEADLADPAACAALIREVRPACVINAAAYTAVDRAETEPELARLVNARAPGAMAAACAEAGIPFLHVSTDYVFDGSGEALRREEAPTGPLGAYGQTKLDGERAIAAAGGQWAVLRTSWVFSAHGTNFVRTMRRLGAERERLTIVSDQVGGPTPAGDIAGALLTMARAMVADPAKGGLYHFAGAPDVSWADFAREIFARSGLAPQVVDIPTSAYPTPARRPLNSRLDCGAITRAFGIARPDWRAGLDRVIQELSA
ncbi:MULTISPECIES: dTDP-4-dehydrorhamnose reductase [unclassified Paracoccus (in: a-proteobacteria)]|uniref:dTDP-4-dehydrorhamnose reductase n=1 Tax=unclassified Paracoccus (in: a-proteobacteria) TaxID=2688777 RepID=UPI001603C4A4|nr:MULTISPECIES: dTDP-4-dehydrorhamnose reductase [unclassified Paracoccus (in: a-proteobacteria)]MBB1491634.1 dTDP-4-dehydrorhamnose reductase [Paracoccus sp. MC1854]MBB1498310.1 dTDP-4-dehydrorhamnose reductase [Paracoccus sp. MC1862]QQO44931.1 dTDP-4-dehydrorhamnose reductase [Paracoccus sp. MC1862]